ERLAERPRGVHVPPERPDHLDLPAVERGADAEVVGFLVAALGDPDREVRDRAWAALTLVDWDAVLVWVKETLRSGTDEDAARAAHVAERLMLSQLAPAVMDRGARCAGAAGPVRRRARVLRPRAAVAADGGDGGREAVACGCGAPGLAGGRSRGHRGAPAAPRRPLWEGPGCSFGGPPRRRPSRGARHRPGAPHLGPVAGGAEGGRVRRGVGAGRRARRRAHPRRGRS